MHEETRIHAPLAREQLITLRHRADRPGVVRLAGHLAVLCATGFTLAFATGYWLPPAMVVHGIVLTTLFAPLHECIHRTAFRRRWLNDGVARLCGLVLVLPADYFRAFHFAHHRHTQDPARDPELACPKPAQIGAYLWQASGAPYWAERLSTIVRHAVSGRVAEGFVARRQHAGVVREARTTLVVYGAIGLAALTAGSTAPLVFWLVPAVLGQPALRLYLMAEHTGCAEVPDMARNTRTTISNPAVRYLMWNMGFHIEHHMDPATPFHALPRLHALVAERLVVVSPGYLAFHRQRWRELLAG